MRPQPPGPSADFFRAAPVGRHSFHLVADDSAIIRRTAQNDMSLQMVARQKFQTLRFLGLLELTLTRYSFRY